MSAKERPGELDALRFAPTLVATPAEVESERARLLPWLEQEIARLPDERLSRRTEGRRRTLLASALAVAAGVGLFWGFGFGAGARPAGAPARTEQRREASAATLLDGRLESGALEVLPGSRLGGASRFRTAASGGARLLTAGGATLAARPDTEFALSSTVSGVAAGDALIELSRGGVTFDVPKVEAGHTFRVRTLDALVTVVGTRFSVEAGAPTCVRVDEGTVRVERGAEVRLVEAGQDWGCDQAAAAEPTAKRASVGSARPGGEGVPTRSEGKLVEQNRLLARALAAERRGEVGRAKQAFEELLSRHPDSPFGPEARAGLVRLQDHR